jgi:hypothetical protein
MSNYRFNPPPGWPSAPEGWTPPDGWAPDPSWPAPPPGWRLWLADDTDAAVYAKGHNGQVTFDGQFITITRDGYVARSRVGTGAKRIAVAQVTAVQWRSAAGLALGYIQFTMPGRLETRQRLLSRRQDPNRDENSITFYTWDQPPFEALRASIESALLPTPVAPIAPASPVLDSLDELRKLAELRDAGILTPAEFDEQKALVLARRARA